MKGNGVDHKEPQIARLNILCNGAFLEQNMLLPFWMCYKCIKREKI